MPIGRCLLMGWKADIQMISLFTGSVQWSSLFALDKYIERKDSSYAKVWHINQLRNPHITATLAMM